MAKIVDPDALNRNVEIVFDTTNKRIQLVPTGNLQDTSPASTSGVTLQAVYSKCKELWKSEDDLNRLKFPFDAITPVKMDLINDWDWADATTRRLIRDGGWSVRDAAGVSISEFMSIASLGGRFVNTIDTAYYQQVEGFTVSPTEFYYADEVNEPVQIYLQNTFDYRDFFKIFLREWGTSYEEGNLLKDQALPSLDYTAYKVPLVNEADPKITAPESSIPVQPPYIYMDINFIRGHSFTTWVSGNTYDIDWVVYNTFESPGRWYRSTIEPNTWTPGPGSYGWETYPGERQIGTDYYAFNRIIDGATASLENIYEFAQYRLKNTMNINDDTLGENWGTVYGNVACLLLSFLGDVLQTKPGVFVDNITADDRPRIEFFDITVDGGGLDEEGVPKTSTKRTYPFISSGRMVFNDYLVDDPDAIYKMYFKEVPGGTFDETSAIIVNDADGNPIQGTITTSEIEFTFDYDFNTQGGRTAGTDAPVVLVALGLNLACWVMGEFTITRSVGLRFPLTAPKERNYSNP